MVVMVHELVIGYNDYLLKRVIDFGERKAFLSSFFVGIHLIGRLDVISL